MNRRVLATIALIAITACAPRSNATHPLRLAIVTDPRSFVPILSQSIQDDTILRLVYDPLIASDASGQAVPVLAAAVPTRENGGISRDGRTITYRLRSGVHWHDGRPFTSADVAATFRAIMSPSSIVQTRHGYDAVARVETPDPLTVRFRLKRPFAPFVGTVFAESDAPFYVAPAHLLDTASVARSSLAANPIGTGPYRLTRWVRADHLDFTANRDYFGGAPSIPQVHLRIIPDENTQLVGLRSGDLDGIIGISANAAAQARAIPHVRIVAAPLNAYWGVMMNNAPGHPTADVRVRRAIAEAIDARSFRDNVTFGYYARAIADLPLTMWAADPSLSPIAHDPAGARRLLALAGYGPGKPLVLELAALQSSQTHRIESVSIQSQLRAIGVDVHIHSYLANIYDSPPAQGGIITRGRYDIALYGWFAGMDPDNSGQFSCNERPPHGYDHSFYCNPAMDALQREALAAYDRPTRKRAYAKIEALLLKDVPIAFLGSPVSLAALRDSVSGYTPSFTTQTANANRWRFTK